MAFFVKSCFNAKAVCHFRNSRTCAGPFPQSTKIMYGRHCPTSMSRQAEDKCAARTHEDRKLRLVRKVRCGEGRGVRERDGRHRGCETGQKAPAIYYSQRINGYWLGGPGSGGIRARFWPRRARLAMRAKKLRYASSAASIGEIAPIKGRVDAEIGGSDGRAIFLSRLYAQAPGFDVGWAWGRKHRFRPHATWCRD